jgi:hypothetical protein
VKPELYKIYNDGCVVDLVEEGMGKGGGDLCVELKVYSSLVGPQGASSPNETSYHGDTHGFGNTEERLKTAWCLAWKHGRATQHGTHPRATGLGRVARHKGDYHDAIHAKRNTIDRRIHNTFGGFNRSAARALHALSKRATDRTEYKRSRTGQRPSSSRTGGNASPPPLSWPTPSAAVTPCPACVAKPDRGGAVPRTLCMNES